MVQRETQRLLIGYDTNSSLYLCFSTKSPRFYCLTQLISILRPLLGKLNSNKDAAKIFIGLKLGGLEKYYDIYGSQSHKVSHPQIDVHILLTLEVSWTWIR